LLSPPHAIPTRLYKYRSLRTPDERVFVQKTFTHEEVYFASPADFNDPFDCRVCASFDGSDADWLDYYCRLAHKHLPNLTVEQRETEARRWLAAGRHNDPKAQREMLADLQREADGLGIYCVTALNDSLAMWARYADGHRGICLEFEHLVGLFHPSSSCRAAIDVQYSDQLPVVSVLCGDSGKVAVAHLLTKSSEWRDEHEYRFIDFGGPGVRKFTSNGLVGVILGCRIPEADRHLIRDWTAAVQSKPRLYEAVIKEGEYALQIVEDPGY
jgi:hypothetical protein